MPKHIKFELTGTHRTTNTELRHYWDNVRNREDRILETSTRNSYCTTLDESIFEYSQNDDEIILCLQYDGLYGINNINRLLQKSNPNPSVKWEVNTYKINDPVVFNDSRRFEPTIYNNLKGKITRVW